MNNEEYNDRMRQNIVQQKSYAFSIEIVKMCKILQEKREYILSKLLLKSDTSIGANIQESAFGQSKADFISKLSIALKEANEVDYWLQLLSDTGYINPIKVQEMRSAVSEILALLIASLKTAKHNCT